MSSFLFKLLDNLSFFECHLTISVWFVADFYSHIIATATKVSKNFLEIFILLSKNPELFPIINQDETIRRAVITKHNTIYYKKLNEVIEILSFFSNKKNPDKLDL